MRLFHHLFGHLWSTASPIDDARALPGPDKLSMTLAASDGNAALLTVEGSLYRQTGRIVFTEMDGLAAVCAAPVVGVHDPYAEFPDS